MKPRTTTIALIAILVPSVCFAWGRDGHRITGYIAETLLTPQARAAIRDLLGNESLSDVSAWADEKQLLICFGDITRGQVGVAISLRQMALLRSPAST